MFLDSAQSVADRIRVANKHLSCAAHRRIVVLPHPKRFEKRLPVLVGKVAKTVQRSAGRFDHHLRRAHGSGGQDGAVEHRDRGCGIGRAPQHHSCDMQGSWRIAQILEGRTDPTRAVVIRDSRATTLSSFRSDCDVHDPDLQIRQPPPRRIDVKAAQLRLDLGQRLITPGGNVGGDDYKWTVDRQPKLAGDLPQAPLVERSSLKQRVNQTRTSRRLSQELPVLLVAMTGHQCGGDQFGEAADAHLGVGRHRAVVAGNRRPPGPTRVNQR